MALKLEGLTESQKGVVPGEGVSMGALVVTPDHQWFARRDDGEKREGAGNFRKFGSGFWVNNLSFDESKDLFRGSLSKTVRSETWWKISVSEILAEWNSAGMTAERSANLLSMLFGRMSKLMINVIRETASDAEAAETEWRNLCHSASLPTGIYCLFEKQLEKHVPMETEMWEHFDKTRQVGFGFRKNDLQDNEVVLDFRKNIFSHAREIFSRKVPDVSIWKRTMRDESMSVTQFIDEIIDYGRPALIRALFSPHDEREREWVSAFINSGTGERSRFLAEEIKLLSHIPMEVDSALIGSGWADSVMKEPMDVLSRLCGGDEAAALSWSAGVIAENILAAPHRTGRNKTSHASGDSIWSASADRVLLAPVVEAIESAGGRILQARTGRITVAAAPVPEVIGAIVWAAWDLGAHLDYGSVARLTDAGICSDLPTERASFGGGDADYIFAAANHSADRAMLWKLDGIPFMPDETRKQILRGFSLLP